MISVICVYNNTEILDEYLLKSLKNQTVKFELIALDNTQGKFKSAAEALNHGGKQVKGKYIMFVHQDADLSSNSWLEDAEKMLDPISNLGIAGIAGMSETGNSNKERGRNIIKHGDPPIIWSWGNPIQEPDPVQTLDECLVIIPKSVFNVLQFDEKVCDDWHLYAVDYCLSVRRLNLDAYVLPLFIHHKSRGFSARTPLQIVKSLDSSYRKGYYQTLRKIVKKHKKYYKRIYTTCGNYNISYPLILQRIKSLAKSGLKYEWKKIARK